MTMLQTWSTWGSINRVFPPDRQQVSLTWGSINRVFPPDSRWVLAWQSVNTIGSDIITVDGCCSCVRRLLAATAMSYVGRLGPRETSEQMSGRERQLSPSVKLTPSKCCSADELTQQHIHPSLTASTLQPTTHPPITASTLQAQTTTHPPITASTLRAQTTTHPPITAWLVICRGGSVEHGICCIAELTSPWLPVKNLTSPSCSPTPISYKTREFWRFMNI